MAKLPDECLFPSMGWKARVGLILPQTAYNCLGEFNAMSPKGLATLSTIIALEKVTPEYLKKMEEQVEDAASLLEKGSPDLIIFGCTSGSLVLGPGSDARLAKKIEDKTGIPALVTSTAIVDAMKSLGIKRPIVVTPYIEEIDKLEKKFLEAYGINVQAMRGLGITEPKEIVNVNPLIWYRFAKEIFTPECDGLFISCTGIHTMDIIESLENDLGIPVVTSNQATVWAALERLGIKSTVKGCGKLLSD
ncbi:conserved hypothetical protein [uncultured Spirochaetota bacterium]|jgi:maleate isomerase|nr:conserved hypothetical protein [uncultured Spirochaetota bacterium]